MLKKIEKALGHDPEKVQIFRTRFMLEIKAPWSMTRKVILLGDKLRQIETRSGRWSDRHETIASEASPS